VQPVGVHHVSVNVDDVDAAVAFYTDALGFRLRTDRPDFGFGGAWLDVGNQQVHLIEGAVPDARGQHFAVQVEGLDEVVAELRRRGVTVSEPVPVGRSRQAFLNDPSGNAIELHEVGTARG
jgi:glyoxylase I family protein